MTQEDLADALGMGAMSVSKWERGVSTPPLARLADIGRALGVPAGWLVDGELDEIPPEPAGYERPRLRGRPRRSPNVDAALDALDAAERHLARSREGIEGGKWYLAAADLGLATARLSSIPAYLVASRDDEARAGSTSPATSSAPGPESEATP